MSGNSNAESVQTTVDNYRENTEQYKILDPIFNGGENLQEEELFQLVQNLSDTFLERKLTEAHMAGTQIIDLISNFRKNDPRYIYFILAELAIRNYSLQRVQVYSIACEFYKKAIEHGMICQLELGLCFEMLGDVTKAKEAYLSFPKGRNIRSQISAMMRLANMYMGKNEERKIDIQQAVKWFREAANLLELYGLS